MLNGEASHLLVLANGELLGVITEHDLKNYQGRVCLKQRTASEVMKMQSTVVNSNYTLRQAANLMRKRGLSCLPVVEGNEIAGLVTLTELINRLSHSNS